MYCAAYDVYERTVCTQMDRLLRRHNDAPMNGIDRRRMVYNISDYRQYGRTMTASLPLPQPHWHGWNIPR